MAREDFPEVGLPPPKSNLWFALNNAIGADVPGDRITHIVDALERFVRYEIVKAIALDKPD